MSSGTADSGRRRHGIAAETFPISFRFATGKTDSQQAPESRFTSCAVSGNVAGSGDTPAAAPLAFASSRPLPPAPNRILIFLKPWRASVGSEYRTPLPDALQKVGPCGTEPPTSTPPAS